MSELDARQRENLELADRTFAGFRPEASEEMLPFVDPSIEVHTSSDLANAGTYRGHDGFLSWIGQWLDAWDDYELEVRELTPVGERHVAGTLHQTATGRGSGVPVTLDVGAMVEFSDRKLSAIHLYPTVAEAERIAERREGGERTATG
jgi:ketosteroid isomerase-like protein